MGSLKDEMKGLREDHKPCEEQDDGEYPGSSDAAPQINISEDTTTQGCFQPKTHRNAEESNVDTKEQVLSGGVYDDTDQPDSRSCMPMDTVSLTQQPEADETTAAQKDNVNDGDAVVQRENSNHKNTDQRDTENKNIMVSVPSTPSDPLSPAPFGQHHMHTQVSLEVVQCCSAATSPMTPPEGGNSFFFPNSFGKSGAVGTVTQDADLQVGRKVEFCSVATSPMTPKTPSVTAFPELIGRETVQKEGGVKTGGQGKSGQQESFPVTKSPVEAESTEAFKITTSKELSEVLSSKESPESSGSCPAAALIDSQKTLEDSNHQCKQQRMGSMDQDITILVTHYGTTEGDEAEAELSFYTIETEMVKIDEAEELGDDKSDLKEENGAENVSTETVDQENSRTPQNKVTVSSEQPNADENSSTSSEVKEDEKMKDTSGAKPPVPESPAPFGCHNIRTQVSLEVVQCQSVATSPMTPPEGDHAFHFPSTFGKAVGSGTKDTEMQVGQQVEYRSVATAPMTPRTPTTTSFPDIREESSIKEKIAEVEEDELEQVSTQRAEGNDEVVKGEDNVTDGESAEAAEEEDAEERSKEKGEEKCEEPVQEVSWDEKGMTWEVYGAVVEVAVLGSAIQKHLEKQVKKQKRQPSLPPPPPLNPLATPLASEAAQGSSGSGKGRAGKRGERGGKVSRNRRNPFRLLMENMQQPHCCSRAHTTE
ncbi:uncharacterized protein gprin1 [Aulostomus maculatus]